MCGRPPARDRARKLKSPLAGTAQEADEHLCAVLVSGKKEAGGVQAHDAMLPNGRGRGQGESSGAHRRRSVPCVPAGITLVAVSRRLFRRLGLLVLLAGVVQAVRRALRTAPPNDVTATSGAPTATGTGVRAAPPAGRTPAVDTAPVAPAPPPGAADAPDRVTRAPGAEPPAPTTERPAAAPAKAATRKAPAAKRASAKKAAAEKAPAKKAPAKKGAPAKAPADSAPAAKKAPADGAAPAKKAPGAGAPAAKKAPAKKAADAPKKAAAKKAPPSTDT
jgi:hypothetical protein